MWVVKEISKEIILPSNRPGFTVIHVFALYIVLCLAGIELIIFLEGGIVL